MVPREINFLITWKCNLGCRHCTVSSCGDEYRDMSLDEISTVLDKLVSEKVLTVTVTGGEPLARRDFEKVWREFYTRPLRINLNTNGTLLTHENIDRILEAGRRLDDVMISLDGPDAETVDALRGEGTFHRLESSLLRLRSRNLNPYFYCTVTSLNIDRMDEILAYASQFSDVIKLNPVVRSGPDIPGELVPSRRRLVDLIDSIPSLMERHSIRLVGVIPDLHKIWIREGQGNWPSFSCGAPSNRFTIFPDGTVSPCDHLPSLQLGNLLYSGLLDILSSPAAQKVRETIAEGLEDVDECADCRYRNRCTVGCPVFALAGNRDDIRDPYSCLRLLRDG